MSEELLLDAAVFAEALLTNKELALALDLTEDDICFAISESTGLGKVILKARLKITAELNTAVITQALRGSGPAQTMATAMLKASRS